MINWDLLTETEQRICRLELTIQKFKEYDERRKIYLKTLEENNKDLREKLEELKIPCSSKEEKLKEKIKNYKVTIKTMQEKAKLAKNVDLIEEMCGKDKFAIIKSNIELSEQIAQLRKSAESLKHINKVVREANAELINKLFNKEDALIILEVIEKLIIAKLQ